MMDSIPVHMDAISVGDTVCFGFRSLLPRFYICASHSGTQNRVPMDEERLCKVIFDANRLMVDVVVVGVVAEKEL